MDKLNSDFWKQFAASMVRKLLVITGAYLVQHGWISGEQSNGLTSIEIVQYVVGAIFLALPVAWGYAKTKFNVLALREAIKAPQNTTVAEVQADTLSKHTIISSV